MEMIDAMHV